MGLFSSSDSKSETRTSVEDSRVAASEGSTVDQLRVAGKHNTLSVTSLDPATVERSLDLARFAIAESTRGAEATAAGFLEATSASRTREQELLAAALTPEQAQGQALLQTILILAGLAAAALVLVRWRR